MRRKITIAMTGLAAAGALAGGAVASGAGSPSPSRLDDGAKYASQAKINEQQAIAAAQGSASGALDEVDLERVGGRLVYTVDVGSSDVEVDATTGEVVTVEQDD